MKYPIFKKKGRCYVCLLPDNKNIMVRQHDRGVIVSSGELTFQLVMDIMQQENSTEIEFTTVLKSAKDHTNILIELAQALNQKQNGSLL